jgi:hypothetical protein
MGDMQSERFWPAAAGTPKDTFDRIIFPKLEFIRYCPCNLQLFVKRYNSSPRDGADRWTMMLLSAQIATEGRLSP